MNKIVSLYLARRDVPTRMDVVQRATAPAITFILEDYAPASGSQARIFIKKKQSEVYRDCTLSGNEITFTPTTTSFDEAGECQGQLQIMKGQTIAVSFRLYIRVEPNIIDNEAIEASDDFNALETALAQVGDLGALRTQVATNTSNIAGNTTDITNIKAKTDRLNIESGITSATLGRGTETSAVKIYGNANFKVAIGATNSSDNKGYLLAVMADRLRVRNETDSQVLYDILPTSYIAGDTVTFTGGSRLALGGYIDAGAKNIVFTIPLPRDCTARTATVSLAASNGLAVKGVNGYVGGGNIDTTASDITVAAATTPIGVRVTVSKTTAFSNATDNSPVGVELRGSITFS